MPLSISRLLVQRKRDSRRLDPRCPRSQSTHPGSCPKLPPWHRHNSSTGIAPANLGRRSSHSGVGAWLGSWHGAPPSPWPFSPHLDAVGPPEPGHGVEDLAGETDLDLLATEGPAPHALTEDALVSEHRVLHQAPPAVA